MKTNPNYIREVRTCSLYDEIEYIRDNEKELISAKEVSLMGSKSTFSASLGLKPGDYLLRGIDEVMIKDFTHNEKEAENVHSDFDMLDLFSQE